MSPSFTVQRIKNVLWIDKLLYETNLSIMFLMTPKQRHSMEIICDTYWKQSPFVMGFKFYPLQSDKLFEDTIHNPLLMCQCPKELPTLNTSRKVQINYHTSKLYWQFHCYMESIDNFSQVPIKYSIMILIYKSVFNKHQICIWFFL